MNELNLTSYQNTHLNLLGGLEKENYILGTFKLIQPINYNFLFLLLFNNLDFKKTLYDEDVLVYLKDLKADYSLNTKPFSLSKHKIVTYLKAKIALIDLEIKKQFTYEEASLNQYYKDALSEIASKKMALYYHTYYFEKEEQLIKEERQIMQEMQEQGELLIARFLPKISLEIHFLGEILC